jgi:hypothetical protein
MKMKEMISYSRIIIKRKRTKHKQNIENNNLLWLYSRVHGIRFQSSASWHQKVNAPCKLQCRNGCSSYKDEKGPFQDLYISRIIITMVNNNSYLNNDICCIILLLVLHPKIAYPFFQTYHKSVNHWCGDMPILVWQISKQRLLAPTG